MYVYKYTNDVIHKHLHLYHTLQRMHDYLVIYNMNTIFDYAAHMISLLSNWGRDI